MLTWFPFMWPERTLGTMMVPKIFIFKKCASKPLHRPNKSKYNFMDFLIEKIFQSFLNLQKYNNLSKNPWICICFYLGIKYAMNCCDTAIERFGCTLFENKKLNVSISRKEKMTRPYHFKKCDFPKGIPLQKSNFLKS